MNRLANAFFYAVAFIALLICITNSFGADTKHEGIFSVKNFGAKGDAITDDTAAMQKALDEAAKLGGRVYLPPAKYLVKGSLKIPPDVMLEGAIDAPVWSEPLKGSVILATGGQDNEDGPALFDVGTSASVRALTVYYPEQKVTDIHPYPWTFHMHGPDNTVENVTLINSYNGIRVGPENSVRHRIRSVFGCVLRRGIFVEFCTDIGRIDNVQFHCHWWTAAEVGGDNAQVKDYMIKHLEAFIFGRTDWEYVNNTFVFPVNIGYRFIRAQQGMCNGHFSGIGADEAQICVKVDEIQPMGLLISDGEFVCMHGDIRDEVVVESTCNGSVRLVNCAFWGPSRHNVVSHSQSFVSLSDCFFSTTRRKDETALSLIEADGGKLQVRGCSFGSRGPDIALRKGLKHAIVSENNGRDGVTIINEIGDKSIITNNEPASTSLPEQRH